MFDIISQEKNKQTKKKERKKENNQYHANFELR
jgi:hypothetical protein